MEDNTNPVKAQNNNKLASKRKPLLNLNENQAH